MALHLYQVIFLGYLVAVSSGQLFNEWEQDDEFDDRLRIESQDRIEETKAGLSEFLLGGSHAALAKNILRSDLLGDSLRAGDGSLCPNHTELIKQSVMAGEPWALQIVILFSSVVVDSIGRQPSALLYDMNFRWLGSWEECLAVKAVAFEDPINKTGPYTPFDPWYCNAKFNFKQLTISRQVTIGMCLPSSCTTAEMKTLAQTLVEFLQLPKDTLKIRSVSCPRVDEELSDKAIAVTVVCFIFVAVMIIATIYDFVIILYLDKTIVRTKEKEGIPNPLYESTIVDSIEKGKIASNSISPYNSSGSSETTPLLLGGGNHLSQSATQTTALSHKPNDVKKVAPSDREERVEEVIKYKPNMLGRALLSFSVYTNGCKILNATQPPGSLTSVNGIRFLSMAWVILGHVLSFKGNAPDNYNTWIAKMIKRWPFQAIANATVSVDTFFVLSGLLVAFLSLKEMKKKGGPKRFNWFLYYFHRFWRLTPPYMLVMMVYVPLMKYWGDGPLWNVNGIEKNECENTWWRNLLYINNLVDDKENGKCMGWAWYLANDMQFYIISPIMLIPLYYSKIGGSIVCFALILMNLITTGVISKHHNFSATPKIKGPRSTPGVSSFDTIYIKPYTRIGPYVIGIMVGYILYKTNCKVRMRKIWALLGWVIAAVLALLVVYGPYTEDGMYQMSEEESAFYNSAHRIGWGLAVGWLIFACATGYGGPINTLLSWKGIIPLSRLTYCAYLVHPIVMRTYFGSVRQLQHWYDLEFVYQFLGNLTLSMALAFVVSLAFEAPMMGLEKVLLAKYKK